MIMDFSTIVWVIQIIIWWSVLFYFFFSLKWKIDTIYKNNKKIESLNKFIEDLSSYFYWIKWNDIPNNLKNYNRYYQANSPLRLNEKWETFIKDSGFLDVFTKDKEEFISWIKVFLDWKTRDESFFYFVEKFSIDFIIDLENKNNPHLDSVRKYIFDNWLSEIKDIIFKNIWLYIRDEIIKDYWKWEEFCKIKDNK